MAVGPRSGRGARSAEPPWLPLGAAARLLGVDPDTLRRWADNGRVRSFTTPGGHRRFDRIDLDRLVATARPAPAQPRTVGLSAPRVEAAYRRRLRAGRFPLPGSWVDQIGDAERERFRERGRRLQFALVASLEGDARTSSLAEAERVGAEYGASAARLGLPLTEAVAAFLASRGPLLAELAAIAGRRKLTGSHTARLMRTAADVLDRVLLELVAAHVTEQASEPAPSSTPPPQPVPA